MKNAKKFIATKLNMTACLSCKHLLEDRKCAAFPKGIPKPIWEAENDHTKAYPGDNGIIFEKGK